MDVSSMIVDSYVELRRRVESEVDKDSGTAHPHERRIPAGHTHLDPRYPFFRQPGRNPLAPEQRVPRSQEAHG